MSFFGELKRRNVVRVAIAYIVVGWLVFQIGEVLFPVFGTPDWVFKTIILLVALGFPFVLLFAWAFELTPAGVRKTGDVDITASVTATTGRKLDFVIIAALIAALVYFVWERQDLIDASDSQTAAEVVEVVKEPKKEISKATSSRQKKSIAVIPFVNMSSDEEQEWFADGLTEEILNSLARTPDLLVSARTSSFAYKGSKEDAPTIAAALGVAHVLEGSVRRAGDRLRVTAQLIRADDGFHMWSETYDRNIEDLIDIQENVAIAIANALETAMDPEALAKMVEAGTASVPAYEAYLQGLSYGLRTFALGDPYDYLDVREAYQKAVALDPEFARAYWKLALFWSIQLDTMLTVSGITELSGEEIIEQYFYAIENAIKYEKNEASSLLYRASRARTELNYPKAARLLARYLEHRPNDEDAQILWLVVMAETGQAAKIENAVARFLKSDSHNPGVATISASALLNSPDNEIIREYAYAFLDTFPDHIGVAYQAHRMLLWAGDIDGASKLAPRIQSSDMAEESRYLVSLRQACAENRIEDARVLYSRGNEKFADQDSIIWLGHMIMGNSELAATTLMPFDSLSSLKTISGFMNYSWFDSGIYPNLSAMLQQYDIERPAPSSLPYQCKDASNID